MIVSFNIPDAIVTELNLIAQEAAFANAKQMIIAYLKAEIKAHRDNIILKNIPIANMDDVVLG